MSQGRSRAECGEWCEGLPYYHISDSFLRTLGEKAEWGTDRPLSTIMGQLQLETFFQPIERRIC